MTEQTYRIRTWRGAAATFVEDDQRGRVVVTVDGRRAEMPASEWNGLPPHRDTPPHDFDKTPSQAG